MRLQTRKYSLSCLIGLLAALSIWVPQFTYPNIYDRVDNLVFDAYQRIKPRDWAGSDVVVVDVDEASIKALGQWPWPRDMIADLTDRLGLLGAAAIVFDITFSEADRTSPSKILERREMLQAIPSS